MRVFFKWLPVLLWLMLLPQAGFGAPLEDKEAARSQARQQLELMLFRIRMFHHEVRSSLLSSLELPPFKAYFLLPGSQDNRYSDFREIQLSEAQNALRKRLEEWARVLLKRFPISELCLVDRHGQEHLRLAAGRVAKPHEFSDSEADSPFFKPTFAMAEGEVFFSDPYMSPDANQWVVAFTAPLVLDDGTRPAFFHFELSLGTYQRILSTVDFAFSSGEENVHPDNDEEGRFFIIDPRGLVIADSRQAIRYKIADERNPELHDNLPDYMPPERITDYLPKVASISDDPLFLATMERMKKGESGQVDLTLHGKPYVLFFDQVPDRPWGIAHLDPVGSSGFWKDNQ